jgi:hypothetical protein
LFINPTRSGPAAPGFLWLRCKKCRRDCKLSEAIQSFAVFYFGEMLLDCFVAALLAMTVSHFIWINSHPVVRMPGQQRRRAVELLHQQHAHELMRDCHAPEAKGLRCLVSNIGMQTIRAANQECH